MQFGETVSAAGKRRSQFLASPQPSASANASGKHRRGLCFSRKSVRRHNGVHNL